jgi:hypothetical protein
LRRPGAHLDRGDEFLGQQKSLHQSVWYGWMP